MGMVLTNMIFITKLIEFYIHGRSTTMYSLQRPSWSCLCTNGVMEHERFVVQQMLLKKDCRTLSRHPWKG